jgi:hypothetical protein
MVPDPELSTMRLALHRSLMLLAGIVLLALAGLAFESNWFKLARVSTAFVCYAVVGVTLRRWCDGAVPWWSLAAAGSLAGIASGLVRPETGLALVAGQALGGALFGIAYWLGLVLWWRTRAQLATQPANAADGRPDPPA